MEIIVMVENCFSTMTKNSVQLQSLVLWNHLCIENCLIYDNNMDIKDSHHSLFKIKVIVKRNQKTNFVANPLEAEKNRLQSYNYL